MKKFKFLVLVSVIITAILIFCGCGGYALDTPTNFTLDENNTLAWNEVTDARRYELEITDFDDRTVQTYQANEASFSLSILEEGDYEIRVRALGGKNFKDTSAWSAVQNFEKEYENGCLYKLINNSTEYEIYKVGAAKGTFEIKSYYRNKPVTRIAENAFKGSRKVENVTMGENIEEIGSNAFYNCRNLVSINIPTTVSTIGEQAFQSCVRLQSIVLPDSVTNIKEYTFAYCTSLISFEFGDSVELIDAYAFAGCTAMTTFVVPDSVVEIAEGAFSGDTSLATLTIGKRVEVIGQEAFYRCFALTEVTFAQDGALKELGKAAFGECSLLNSVVLPKGLETIGARAFTMNEVLDSIVIPETVTQVGENAFYNTKLYNDAVTAGEEFICAGSWLVACTDAMKAQLTTITLESFRNDSGDLLEIYGIADQVFRNCSQLTSIKLPQTVKYIGAYAFQNCKNLSKIETFDSLKIIGEGAFANCRWLNNLRLGEGLERIGAYAFYGCSELNNTTFAGTSIIPSSVTSIGTYAFKDTALWNDPDEKTGVVYAGNWVVGFNELKSGTVVLREDTVGISDYAFYKAPLYTLIGADGDEMKYIGRAAFYNCEQLGMISLPRSLTKIDDYTFYKCSSLYSIEIPSFVTSIGRSAFYKCESLSDINLSKSRRLTFLGDYAFYGCLNARTLSLGTTIESIGEYAFANCSSLTSVVIPEKVTEIKKSTFYHCSSLETLTLNENLKEIGVSAFNGCTALQSVVIPDSVTSVGNNAFYKCISATELVLGESLVKVGNYAFFGMESVEILELPSSLESIGKYAFKGFASVDAIVLPTSVKEVGMHAFYGCNQATIYTDAEEIQGEWHTRWNSSYRPVVWGCEFSEEEYWISIEIGETTFSNLERDGIEITAPQRDGYVFIGWATQANGSVAYSANEIRNVASGTTVFAVWEIASEEAPIE